MKTILSLLLPALLTCAVLIGCGDGNSTAPPAAGLAVGGNWTLSKTTTQSTHANCGAANAVISESWSITQAAGGNAISIAALRPNNETLTYTGTVDASGNFTTREERIVSVANRCFIAATGSLSGNFTGGTGSATMTLTSDPINICSTLNIPGSCTATYTFTVRR